MINHRKVDGLVMRQSCDASLRVCWSGKKEKGRRWSELIRGGGGGGSGHLGRALSEVQVVVEGHGEREVGAVGTCGGGSAWTEKGGCGYSWHTSKIVHCLLS